MDNHTLQQVVDLAVKTAVLQAKKEAILECRPVGSIYTSTKPTDPHDLFGGTWEPIQDTFLWCAGPKHAAGTNGGEETHTLTVEEMPKHSHMQYVTANSGLGIYDTRQDYVADKLKLNKYEHIQTGSTGGSQPHNNMPPYKSVYAWQRVK